jgi:2-polyprenyl-3-methyl-5-hydroxy-6-metoxy-1,4-benzoquinol methylase
MVPEFTVHNVVLDDGTQTRPETGYTHAHHGYCRAALAMLKLVFAERAPHTVRVVDLASLEGGYSVEFARAGYDVLGIEVRGSNMACCRYVKERVALPNLSFVQDDAWDLARYGSFDAIFCCGLLYHLDQPRKFLELMSRCCKRLAIINTHFATIEPTGDFALSELTTQEGLQGRWYLEFPDDVAQQQREAARWSSWQNTHSFWPLKNELIRAIRESGFSIVFEQHDATSEKQRCMLIAGKL